MISQKFRQGAARHDGFTLIELGIVLILVGFVASSVALGFSVYNRNLRSDKTSESIKKTREQLELMAKISGYPCPADPTLSPGNANYGVANCDLTNPFIQNVLSRDIGGSPAPDLRVRIGAVPFKTIADFSENFQLGDKPYTTKDGFDGWNHYLTYAVTFDLTRTYDPADADPARPDFDETMGAICIVDESNTNLLEEPCTAHAAIISHGPNGLGAYVNSGNMNPIGDCIDILLPLGQQAQIANDDTPNEKENCDHQIGGVLADAKFVKGVKNDRDNDVYDDSVSFITFRSNVIWERGSDLVIDINGTPLDPTDDVRIPRVSSKNEGAIGIGEDSPQAELHLQGDIQANRFQADLLCDANGQNCFDPELIGGDVADMQCPAGEVVQKIGRVDATDTSPGVECVSPFTFSSFTQCPAGQVVIGISSLTGSICALKP
ncbi:MAG: type II secretion system protein [Alphaproteobacteria bacterium]